MLPVPGTRAYRSTWDETIAAAEEANQPGRFTAFIGYEWTSNTGGNNLHRVVIYRDGGDKAGQVEPYTTLRPAGSDDPKDLWRWLAAYEERTGGQVLAIAHNGNLSNGRMFPVIDTFTGRDFDRAYAETRARWEPLYEVTQIKGDGETHPFLSPNDEFADFERWDVGNLDLTEAKTREMLPGEYARSALRLGLLLEQRLGVNPYRFGMIGSTDSHTGLATADEDNFFGKHAGAEPSAGRAGHVFAASPDGRIRLIGWQQVASGYAGVWARENTRAALFDAMQRKEVYATTGPRMFVRFFGGWEFEPADAHTRNPAIAGYTKGVPMGGDLGEAPRGRAPTFLVAALKDPIGANLDRIQIVKGWLDAAGQTQEKVYDVVWSGDRRPDAQGRLPAVGNTVDVANATWTNTIGAGELITVWRDPDFDPAQRAVYYARVLEIPTPRWTAYDARYFGVQMPPEVPRTIQERAYTSPIWYSPRAERPRSHGHRGGSSHRVRHCRIQGGRKDMTPFAALLRQPMLHFLAGGALLFLAYGLVGGKDDEEERGAVRGQGQERRIVVTRGQVESLASGFAARWRRPPGEEELAEIVAEHVREEALVREALALGLDRGDAVIRRQLRLKMEFLAQDAASLGEPDR